MAGQRETTVEGPPCEPSPSSQSTEERPILTQEGRMHPTTTSPRSETQPPSRPPPPLVLPPATHLHTLSPLLTTPSLRPSIRSGPGPHPQGSNSTTGESGSLCSGGSQATGAVSESLRGARAPQISEDRLVSWGEESSWLACRGYRLHPMQRPPSHSC